MKYNSLQFEIAQLRQQKMLMAIESIAVFVAALFVSAFLPTLLIRYIYASQQLLEAPKVLEYIPVATFVVGVGFFLYATMRNLMHMRRISQLEHELKNAEMDDDCQCGGHHHHEMDMEDLKELDALAAEVVAKNTKSKAKKSTPKRSKK